MRNLWFDKVTGTYGELSDLVVVSVPDAIAAHLVEMADDGERLAMALGQCVLPCEATFGRKLENVAAIVGEDYDVYVDAVASRNEAMTEEWWDRY